MRTEFSEEGDRKAGEREAGSHQWKLKFTRRDQVKRRAGEQIQG